MNRNMVRQDALAGKFDGSGTGLVILVIAGVAVLGSVYLWSQGVAAVAHEVFQKNPRRRRRRSRRARR